MSTIKVKVGEQTEAKRPSWQHTRDTLVSYPGHEKAQLEMLESIRNTMEQIRDSQMLACSVAHDISRLRKAVERIDRRLAQQIVLKAGRHK